jgi:(1->4)-alpha-D-glucan 1-alpha-D-glucosylmutase
MVEKALDRLARLSGIEPEYYDIWGNRRVVPDDTKLALLNAMGVRVKGKKDIVRTLAELESRSWSRLMEPIQVVRENVAPICILLNFPHENLHGQFEWTLLEEDGKRHSGVFAPEELEVQERRDVNQRSFVRCQFMLKVAPGLGYHRVELRQVNKGEGAEPLSGATRLVVTPDSCYMPAGLDGESRVWGPAIQLYALRSGRNWGIGDFTDLKTMGEYCAKVGAGVLGLNPLHALFPTEPGYVSPYSPSCRFFLNFAYLDVEAIADFAECEKARRAVQSPEFQARLAALRDADLVNYDEVIVTKRSVLEMLYRHFQERHLRPQTERGQAFRTFQSAGGEILHAYSIFEALQEHFHNERSAHRGWPSWPEKYRDSRSEAVAEFGLAGRERVEFFQYLQWQADIQLGAVGRLALERGLKVGLYEDLPVSIDSAGFEAWLYQDLYALQARIGAPPDDFNLNGQDWGLPPLIPRRLVDAEYEPFISVLRGNMRHGGAIRVDHVMQFMRLFWVPPGKPPATGAYVHYPFEDLLGILALESQRNSCLVIGEDLGTVPDEVRQALKERGVFSYRLLYFEKGADGDFKATGDYPEQAVAAVTTHDLPTLAGYWQGEDLTVRTELKLFPTEEVRETQIVARSEDRIRLLFALKRERLLPEEIDLEGLALPEMSPELVTAVYHYLARSSAKILMFQLEDILGQQEQVNLPGTIKEYPNWRRKLPAYLQTFSQDPRLDLLVTALSLERGLGTMDRPFAIRRGEAHPVALRIPIATYRLQLNKEFGFAQAADLVPYLGQLGISHCYTSPFLKARPGSQHGYDIVDHASLNPELGTPEEFEHFVDTLHQHGMGLILDIVPNHMAACSDNRWWVDVLENGQASEYADFFDIAWYPLKDELRNKVLLPILEDHYGLVLERGLLRLDFDAEAGQLGIWYHEHYFPIDPGTYPAILTHGLSRLKTPLGAEHPKFLEFESLLTAFDNLPKHWQTDQDSIEVRRRDKEVQKKHLSRLCKECKPIRGFVEENVVLFNAEEGEPADFGLLHRLLQSQPYRLAYWRVASDDINYRRFFDINELAALKMENRRVFEETHRLVLDLVAQGKVDGLRVDHIDGLYDPHEYCQWLCEEAKKSLSWEGEPSEEAHGEQSSPAADPFYLVAEKVLAGYENPPKNWLVQGTTGYEFANMVGGLFVDASHEREMERIYTRFVARKIDYEDLVYHSKKLIMQVAMASELNVLAHALNRIAESHRYTQDFTVNNLRDALREVVACFPVYRTYVCGDSVTDEDRRYVEWAIARARSRSQAADTSVYGFIYNVLVLNIDDDVDPTYRRAVTEFAMKFQQFTGPVMAKGLEDTSFYVYNRLLSLNEVGGELHRFGVSVTAFHHANKERAQQWPHGMLNTSTHDSKRSEDVRARISVLAEIPDKWRKAVMRWSRLNRLKKQKVDTMLAPARNDEYALYQILLGAWPLEDREEGWDMVSLGERIEAYMIKAVREAKVHSSWINPNAEYENAVVGFVRSILEPLENNRFLQEFLSFQRTINRFGLLNSLSQTLVKLTAPGVPDIYQGNEVWHFALVDPDNRRPVDFPTRRGMLQALQSFVSVPTERLVDRALELSQTMEDGRIKLYVTWKTLSLRWQYESVFRDGAYIPLATHGEKGENLCAFARQHEGHTIIVVAPRLYTKLCTPELQHTPLGNDVWSDTWIEVPAEMGRSTCHNLFTGEQLRPDTFVGKEGFSAGAVLAHFPVALLTTEESGSLGSIKK